MYNIAVAQAKKFVQYEAMKTRRAKGATAFEVGDLVMKRKQGRKGDHPDSDWVGPYRISEVHKKGEVTLVRDGQTTRRRAKAKQLKLYESQQSRYSAFYLKVLLKAKSVIILAVV